MQKQVIPLAIEAAETVAEDIEKQPDASVTETPSTITNDVVPNGRTHFTRKQAAYITATGSILSSIITFIAVFLGNNTCKKG